MKIISIHIKPSLLLVPARAMFFSCCALLALASFVPAARAQFILNQIWAITPGDYPWIGVDGTQRGIAYNPITDHVLVVSRLGGNSVNILDASTGIPTGGVLDLTGVSGGGGAALNLIDVADDGKIYLCNLATSVNTFRIYQYDNEGAIPILIYGPADPSSGDTNAVVTNSKRYGDNFTVKGSGTDTRILVNSRGGRVSALLYPTDGTLTLFTNQTIHTDAGNGDMGLGVAFGSANTYWTKAPSRNLRQLNMDLSNFGDPSLTLSAATAVNQAIVPTTTSGLAVDTSKNLLAIIDYTIPSPSTDLYDISNPSAPALKDSKLFPGATANGNGTAAADFDPVGNRLFALASNNGIVGYELVAVTTPVISGGPTDHTILEGGYGSISVTANGTAPLVYFWKLNDTTVVAIKTNNASLGFTNITLAAQGNYSVIVSNSSGTATSTNAALTVAPTVRTAAMTNLWCLPPGSRPYLTTDDTQRGMAYNPVTDRLVLVSRNPSVAVRVLDAATGADAHALDVTGLVGGLFLLNTIGVADDGVVYACNLSTSGTDLKIYRWADDGSTTVPTVAYDMTVSGPLGLGRLGDTFDVRGSGTGTQILLGTHATGTQVVILTTSDGVSFNPVVITTDAPVSFSRLGVAFGSGDTVWAKDAAFDLRHVSFDLVGGSGAVLQSFASVPGGMTVIGVDAQNDFVAGIVCVGGSANPDNFRLFDVIDLSNDPVAMDLEFFPTDNQNGNGTGAVDFGGGRVYALDTNNGLCAYKVVARLKYSQVGSTLTLSWTGPSVLQCSTNVTGTYTNVPGATSPFPVSTAGPPPQKFFILKR